MVIHKRYLMVIHKIRVIHKNKISIIYTSVATPAINEESIFVTLLFYIIFVTKPVLCNQPVLYYLRSVSGRGVCTGIIKTS